MPNTPAYKYVILSNHGASRGAQLIEQLCHRMPVQLKFISIPFSLDLVELARKGIIDLFPTHCISEKLYCPGKRAYKTGTLGCMLNHYIACLELIKDECEYYVLLEDNATLVNDFHAELNTVILSMHEHRFDIIHLFSSLDHERDQYAPGIRVGLNEWGTSKALVISKRYALSMSGRIPFHEVSDGVSMIPSIPWMGSGLLSFIADPYLAGKSPSLPSSRTLTDTLSSESLLDQIILEDTLDPKLKKVVKRHSGSDIDYLEDIPSLDLFVARSMYVISSSGAQMGSISRIDGQISSQIALENNIEVPSHERLCRQIESQNLSIAQFQGTSIYYDNDLSFDLEFLGDNAKAVWTPVSILLPTSVYPCHFRSFPSVSQLLSNIL